MTVEDPRECAELQLSCPHCGQAADWTARRVHSGHFSACCNHCEGVWSSPLPALNMKIIALDTNVISELMKVGNAAYPAQRRARLKPEWSKLRESLSVASKLHAIACPRSPTLEREARLSVWGPAILEMASVFDHGLACDGEYSVVAQQLYAAARASILGEPPSRLRREHVFRGTINGWSDLLRISVRLGNLRNPPEHVRADRQRLHDSALGVFEGWRTRKRCVATVFDEERMSMGATMVRRYLESCAMRTAKLAYGVPVLLEEICDPILHQMAMIRRGLGDAKGSEPTFDQVLEFALSEAASRIPANQVRAALFAFEATQVASGMRFPKSSVWLDVEAIATMLPYVDAILVEGHFAAALDQVKELLPPEANGARVFSARDLESFIAYMDDVVTAVPSEQRAAADALYSYRK